MMNSLIKYDNVKKNNSTVGSKTIFIKYNKLKNVIRLS